MQSLREFFRSESGNIAITFGIGVLGLMGCVGAAVDYSRFQEQKTHFDSAADIAALAAITLISENPKWTDAQKKKNGKAASLASWASSLTPDELKLQKSPTIKLTKVGTAWTSEVEYNAKYDMTLLSLVGVETMNLKGRAKAEIAVATNNWQFFLAIDTSSSMGIGATQADMDAMKSNPAINCQFACHWADYSKGGVDSVTHAHNAGLKLRIDVVDEAVDHVADMIMSMSTEIVPKAAMFGISNKLTKLVPMTTDINAIKNHNIQLDTSSQSIGNTNYRLAMKDLTTQVGLDYDGTTTKKPQKAVFIVTDGVHDSNVWESNVAQVISKNHQVGPMGSGFCQSMKDNDVKVGVLYINYIVPQGFDGYVNAYKNDILPRLQACASDGMFFNATTPAAIETALSDMLLKALSTSNRLTQ